MLQNISKSLSLISNQIQPSQHSPIEERLKVENALKASGGNMARAARSLGMPTTSFRTKVGEYDLIKSTKAFQNKIKRQKAPK